MHRADERVLRTDRPWNNGKSRKVLIVLGGSKEDRKKGNIVRGKDGRRYEIVEGGSIQRVGKKKKQKRNLKAR